MRSKKQLNAISRSYSEKQRKGQFEVLEKYGLVEEWAHSSYKTLTGFLNNQYEKGILKSRDEVYGRM